MIRQIDTTVGLIVGGIVGWAHQGVLIWLLIFGMIFLWGCFDYRETKQRGGK